MNAIPHPDNGRRCPCGKPIYLTPEGWKDRTTNASHPEPRSRRIEPMFEPEPRTADQP